jgi:hypothetical protein
VSLYKNIPVEYVIKVIEELTNKETSTLVRVCLRSTFFTFRGSFYEQTEGMAMGSPLSLVVANLYMEHFEGQALDSFPLKPKGWRRYVDDTNFLWPHGRNNLNEFFDPLNSQHENIKFTMEIEKDNSIPLLDVRITKKGDGSFGHEVYRKPMHMDRYLHVDSHHFPSQKLGVLNTLVTQALRIFDEEHVELVLNHLADAFKRNGYSVNQVEKSMIKAKGSYVGQQSTRQEIKRFSLLYIKGLSEKIAKILRKGDIHLDFSPINTIKTMLDSAKDQIDPNLHKGVYVIPCSCVKVYIGETRRSMKVRFKEHGADLKLNRVQKSSLTENSCTTSHHVCLEDAIVVEKMDNYGKRKVMEALEIVLNPNNLNRDDGRKLSESWRPMLVDLGNVTC